MHASQRTYLLGILCLLGTNGFAVLIPWLLKLAVEGMRNPTGARHAAAYYGGMIIGAALIHGIIRIFSRTTFLHAARRIEYAIREDLYGKLLALDLPYFSGERTGDIMSRFANDLTNVRMLLGFGALNVVNTFIIYVAAIFLMGSISPFLTVCAVSPFPLMIFVVKRMTRRMYQHSLGAQEELARLTSRAEENISAAAVVRAYCREESAKDAFREVSREYLACNMKMARIRGFMLPVMAAASAMGTLVVLFMGGTRVISGAMTLGDFVAFNGYLAMLVWPTVILGWILNLLQRGAASMSRICEVLDARVQVMEPSAPVGSAIEGAIEIRDLRFWYDDRSLLNGISLSIMKGMKLGIVGSVGSGKSTLLRLLARLYPVEDGRIFIDGTDINRIPLRNLRDAIGFVPQESFLFSRTIRDNIAYGKEGADGGSVEAAARLARLEADVEHFSEGYDTLVGERGVTLSGGQKQRTAIARALLKDPAILILDDPLSAVDARTEGDILRGLASYYGDRTVIIVSHRLSAVRECDLIVVMEDGRIVERGRHDELVSCGGYYAVMHREQQLREEIAGF